LLIVTPCLDRRPDRDDLLAFLAERFPRWMLPDDVVVLEHELKSFSIVFSMADIHRIIGPNAARFVGMADQIGTLEPGKLADIILLDGDPTKNVYEMLKTKVVLKEGKIVVDKRPTRQRSAGDERPVR
jgi:cytosine/adenosine deaminase-related metal-dependent hydrolase